MTPPMEKSIDPDRTPDLGLWRYRLPTVLAGLLLLLLMLWLTTVWTKQASLDSLRDEARHQLTLFAAHLQGELEKFEFLPQLLALKNSLIEPLIHPDDLTRIADANRILKQINDIVNASDTYLMDPSGLTLAASNWESERPFVGNNFAYRPYFKEAMEGHLGRYYALGSTSNKRGYYFAYPIRRGEEILGVVVIKINMSPIETAWQNGSDEFVVTDPYGIIFVTTKPEWKFKSLSPLSTETLHQIEASQRYGNADISALPIISNQPSVNDTRIFTIRDPASSHEATSYKVDATQDYLVQDIPIVEAGWKVHVLSNLEPVRTQIHRTVVLTCFVFALLGLTMLYMIQRRHWIREKIEFETRTRKAVEASETRIRTIINNTHAGLVAMDEKGRIESLNPMAEQLFRYGWNELAGDSFSRLICEDHLTIYHKRFTLFARAGDDGTATFEASGKRRDGSCFPMELSIGRLQKAAQHTFIATIHDISERKQNEEALRQARDDLELRVSDRTRDLSKANEQLIREIEEHRRTEDTLRQTQDELIQAAKLAGLGQMSTAIGHELNQPLSAIRSYADNARTLLTHTRMDDVHWNLQQISDLTARMGKIIKQLKVFARKTPQQLTAVPLQAVFDGALNLLSPRFNREGVEIINALPAEELFVQGDMVRLEQVFMNLLTNALQAMSDTEHPRLYIETENMGNKVRITLRDTGPGIPGEHLPHIFDPFFTTKEAEQGLGLGLAICYRIIEGMNGTINAANHPLGGAVFTVELSPAHATKGECI